MRAGRSLGADGRGAAAVEFAWALPLLLLLVIGIVQLGVLFFANADLRNAVAAGSRVASVYPRPDDAAIVERINAQVAGLDWARVDGPRIARGTDSNGNDYADISMSYAVPLDFIFFEAGPVTLTETRRVFTQPERP